MEAAPKPFYSQMFHSSDFISIPDTFLGGWLVGWLDFRDGSYSVFSSCVSGHACSAATFQDLQCYALANTRGL
jgi:hypothetical protein